MPRVVRFLLVVLGLALGLLAGSTAEAMADGETADAPPPTCGTVGRVMTCVYTDGRVETIYLDSSGGGSSSGGGGPQVPPPVPVCEESVVGSVSVCACTTAGETVTVAGECGATVRSTETLLVDVAKTVNRVVATLRLPGGEPQIAPDPLANRWGMLVVGYPVWLSTDAPKTTSTVVTQNGITIRLAATRGRTVFEMGEEGVQKSTVTCTRMTIRPEDTWPHDLPSPDCGYVYQHTGLYTITATTSWQVDWWAAGLSGTLATSRTVPVGTPLRIGELVSVIIDVGP